MNIIDTVINAINPKAAFRRMQYRDAMRNYDAAGSGRRNKNRPFVAVGPNAVNSNALNVLKARHRELTRNNMYVFKAVNSIVNNTVGSGIKPAFLTNARGTKDKLKKIWKYWAESTRCDFDGKTNIYGLQSLVMRTVIDSGECIILKRRVNDKLCPIQLQVLEGDYIDSNRDNKMMSNGKMIIQGIQFDKFGRIEGYYLYNNHPTDFGAYESRFVEASEVLHIYQKMRPGQVRGIPFGVSAMMRMGDFDEYEDAELIRQKIAACFAVFIEDANPEAMQPGSTAEDKTLERVEPGIIEHLNPGRTVKFANPPTTANHDSFTRRTLQGASGGYGITYEALSGDLSNVNFSSARMGRIEMKLQLAHWQELMLIPQLCGGIADWFVGALSITTGRTVTSDDISWTPPKMEMVDPWKETNALQAQVRNGFKSWPKALRELGEDVDEVIKEMVEAKDTWDKEDLMLDCDGRHPVGKPEGNQGSDSNNASPNN